MTTRHLLAAALLAACSLGASAQMIKPGLWEMSNKVGGSPEMDRAMAQMQQQLASMPPEQRKMMQDMMAKQGVSMGGATAGGGVSVKVCISKEMAESNQLPQQTQGDCKTTMGPRTGSSQKFSYVCTQPPSTGEGEFTYSSPESYAMKMKTNTTVQGKPQTMTMEGTGKWQSADCGAIKPARR
ncbi:MAG: DUF3617 domain-containing protein [Comamonadaceae bacterium]|nr:MAG: DUF3617 domain-containing protein [Comamonadaceae bacterium]